MCLSDHLIIQKRSDGQLRIGYIYSFILSIVYTVLSCAVHLHEVISSLLITVDWKDGKGAFIRCHPVRYRVSTASFQI